MVLSKISFDVISDKTKSLFFSYALWGAAYPIISLFINAFIWRQTGSFINVAGYNLGLFIGLPFGFLFATILLRKINIKFTYILGLLISIIAGFLAIFLSSFSFFIYLTYGLIYGVGSGLYWSSRNYLTLQETKDEHRNYFFSIVSLANKISGMVVAFVSGWIIFSVESMLGYSATGAYLLLIFIAFIFMLLSGLVIFKTNLETPTIKKIWQLSISKKWNQVRIVAMGMGVLDGSMYFLPTLLILYFLGKENVLGTISAVVSLISMLLLYIYGKYSSRRDRKYILLLSFSVNFLLALLLALFMSHLSVYIFVLLCGLSLAFYWLALNPWFLSVMDTVLGEKKQDKFVVIFDHEIFLNLGRIVSVIISLVLVAEIGILPTLQFLPLTLTLLQLIIFAFAYLYYKDQAKTILRALWGKLK
ncbi:hypothetical protein A2316_01495 [Candidatus Falkowbacteria bacterium RIFOXYB2_FULL_38_15]|uniref:Major facilitator superfamily (MFS) profile domain-containing protein n=1 Tax=Candidatus Falkowbacteria bacterium RIFOXYA2_FULL_38_12 TaxID=1797993 RepID=A0A1F5S1D9_9BACT|nr:MAG: hypothetical protein A2257_03925 [Candidatus Falkowbacteria bacterium RIFOXYA2_FULL_38_12]OGF32913.1 MAG: hypothetical protein A2316_01495 [Candidatus Falkowbacteria bacterium RIFOXYB2_FULL_38_15]OGF44133.1 MAG: hypothetical protein A2555_01970 [Candidatus Falkowbacteria bacterium RIFOXYD2_FULL_39_16]